MRLLYLVLGGAAGTVSRYFLSSAVSESFGRGFPCGTLIVNVLGCFIVGVLSTVNQGGLWLNDELRMLLAVGFCSAFTTFSAMILESVDLAKGGMSRAFLYVALSLLAGFAAFFAGHRLGRAF